GSFSGSASQDGVFANTNAHFTYTFSGHTTVPGFAGQLRENITYDNGTPYSCSTDIQTWSATRESQGEQTTSPPPPGSYSGSTWQGYGTHLYVSSDSKQLQDVQVNTKLCCTPGGTHYDQLPFPTRRSSDLGSFSGSASQDGVFANTNAHFTYT